MPSSDTRSLLKLASWLDLLARSMGLATILIFALGIYSVYWPAVPGTIMQQGSIRSSGGGYNTPRATKAHSVNVQLIQYSYHYQGKTYNSWLPCFCLPIGIFETIDPNTAVPVYVLNAIPSISVLRTGPDLPSSLVLLVLGSIPWGFARLIRNFVAKERQAP